MNALGFSVLYDIWRKRVGHTRANHKSMYGIINDMCVLHVRNCCFKTVLILCY